MCSCGSANHRLFYGNGDVGLYFYVTDPMTPETYTLSLHDALPISGLVRDSAHALRYHLGNARHRCGQAMDFRREDRKSTRLNSSHRCTSYAVFCSKKKS